jgi:hypothetical protein
MQTRTAIGLVAAFTAGMTLVPMSAKAVCQQEIQADRSFSDGTNSQILGRLSSVVDGNAFTFAYFASTTNAVLASQIFAASANHNRVFIVASATACPTTGALRDMGNILQLYVNP